MVMASLKEIAVQYSRGMRGNALHIWAQGMVEAVLASETQKEDDVSTNLSDLVGKGMLDAVDFGTESRKRWNDEYEDCSVCRFRLNGTVYLAVEDPSDGYRSSMADLVVQRDAALSNTFPPIEVVGIYRDKRGYNSADILELVDTTTGKVVLEVGTDNSDDYYPSFIASFSPENIALNAALS